jgi:hypothetical protein
MKSLPIVICALLACSGAFLLQVKASPSAKQSAQAQALRASEAETATQRLTVSQRSQVRIDAKQTLFLHIGDITAGQVTAWVTDGDKIVFGPESMYEGKVVSLQIDQGAAELKLEFLHNELIGQDYAHFVLELPKAKELPETDQVEV